MNNASSPIPPSWRDEWTSHLAAGAPQAAQGQSEKFFVLRLGAEWCGLPPILLSGTLPDRRISRLPHPKSTAIEGVVNAEGRIILALALEKIFGVIPAGEDPSAQPRLLIVHDKKWSFAFRARHVLGIQEIDSAKLQPLTDSASGGLRRCARGLAPHQNRSIVCLDAERFLHEIREAVK